jgi:hypothetical protein
VEEAHAQRLIRFDLHALDPAALRTGNPGFEAIAASAPFTAGAFLEGDLYLASPAGLSDYAPDGTLRHLWRTGLDLPDAPLIRLATGRLRGASEPQLLVATSGAGVLMLSPWPHPAFQQLLPADPDARDVTDLLPTASGDLLLGTRRHGLLIYNSTTLEPAPIALPGLDAARLQVTVLAGDGSSFLMGTRDAGLFYAHAGTVDRIDSSSGLPDVQVESLTVAGGKAYAGTPVGVAEIDLASPHASRILAPGVFAHSLAVNASGDQLTVGTLDQGIVQVPLTHARLRTVTLRNSSIRAAPTPFEPFAPTGRIEQLFAADSGSPLYALSGDAVLRASASGWSPVLTSVTAALTDRNISALAFAADGRLWVGFFDRGLDILNPDLTRSQHLEDDHLFCLNRLVLDPRRHTMAAATANGFVLFDASGQPRQTLTRRDGLISDHINDIAFTASGATLATPAGLTFLSSSGATSLYAFQGLVNNHVYALGVSPDAKQLLAGTLGGLSLLDANAPSVRRNLTATNSSLRHNWITSILAEPDGGWLIGTYGAGIERMNSSGSFTPIDLPGNAPRDLVINPNAMLSTTSAVYAGTLGHGLLVFLNTTQRWSLIARGLPSLNVTAFAQRDGQLYVGTDNGLVRIPEQMLARYVSEDAP